MLRVAFYKEKGKFIDKVIRWRTTSKYSHCEFILPDGRMFSADAWSGGVRFNQNYNLDNWDIVEIPCEDYKIKELVGWCDYRNGSKYDWWGVVWFVLPFVKQEPSKWFCSELCAAGLKFIGKIPVKTKTSKLSPQGLFDLLKGK